MACRASRLLNGGLLVFSAKYQSAVSVFTCTWPAYFVLLSWLSWSDGIWSPSNTSLALPFCTWVTSSETWSPYFSTISFGYPAGCACALQTWKYGLRTSTAEVFGLYDFHMYGPVPGGTLLPVSFLDVLAGTTYAKGSASLSRNSGSGAVRWIVRVEAASSATTP